MKTFDYSKRQSLRKCPDAASLRQTFVYQSALTPSVNNLKQAQEKQNYRMELEYSHQNLN